MEPWFKIATPRKEVREGRSFNPDEFAIHLEQVINKTAPEDYRDPVKFFSRTCFTKALREHTAMVLRRLSGETANTAPVMTLITQFGGGKTHTLATLYHLVSNGAKVTENPNITAWIKDAGITTVPDAKVAAFVGNAWDPQEGRETPWIDIARQIAGDKGVKELGDSAKNTPPGTEALDRVFKAADGPILILFDEVLNYLNRHRGMADQFHAFIQNLTVAITGITNGAAVISLPRSQVEMTDWDMQWQDKITKVVRRVAKDLIANDEAEIGEVVRRRLFENIGNDRIRKNICKTYATWCFERRAQLPREWTAVDTAATENKAKEFLQGRFEACYPFHPATLSVFQRKWQALTQYQQTRGTLAMLAQWISWAYRTGFTEARREPLITLGSAPLETAEFRSVMLGQLGESRLVAAIDADISGAQSHARALDADSKAALRDIHRRVAKTILFESSGGQTDKVAHLPELRFALGEPEVDTTSVDNAAYSLEDKSYFIRRVGTDGFKIGHQPTMKKVVSDRRASLDEDTETKPSMKNFVQKEFEKGASIPVVLFPPDGVSVQDTPRLTLVVLEPGSEWSGKGDLKHQISEWTKQRGKSPRLYPGSLVWCIKKPGREFKEKVELWLAWKHVNKEINEGTLGGDFDRTDLAELRSKLTDAEEAAKDEVWGCYRFVVIYNPSPQPSPNGRGSKGDVPNGRGSEGEGDNLKIIDLGAGHSSGSETLCGRVITALKSQALLNESVGAGYIERNWPPALKESGSWPLASLRQSFLNGSLTRLIDPDTTLRGKIIEFVLKGDFAIGSGQKSNGSYERIAFNESIDPADVMFDSDVFLILKNKAKELVSNSEPNIHDSTETKPEPGPQPSPTQPTPDLEPESELIPAKRTFQITGDIPPEIWNRLGTKILPKLRNGSDIRIGIDFSVTIDKQLEKNFEADINQILEDLGISGQVIVE